MKRDSTSIILYTVFMEPSPLAMKRFVSRLIYGGLETGKPSKRVGFIAVLYRKALTNCHHVIQESVKGDVKEEDHHLSTILGSHMIGIDKSHPTFPLAAALVYCFVVAGCRNTTTPADDVERAPVSAKSATKKSTDPGVAAARSQPRAHDPEHPPIDCPLRRQGIDPSRMRPFDDVEKYIAFLDRADRVSWQKPDEVVAALGLKGAETVFDLGAGSGYFSFRFAEVLPLGKVIAADTEPDMVRHIHHRVMGDGIENVEAKLIRPTDPGVTSDADLVFVCDVLHHVADRQAWLAKLVGRMKSGARLALIEFKEGRLPEGPPEAVKIPRGKLVELITKAGLELEVENTALLPYQVFLVFRKP